jgi:UDP-GlcNAc:undecaprenyl-phosphate GlcNAc-1-phosphate transferase
MPENLTTTYFIFEALLISLLMVLIIAWASIQFSRNIRLIDFPDSAPHKLHDRPTPLAGGIAIVATLLIAGWLLGTFSDTTVRATSLALVPLFIFGLWDDLKNIPPIFKLSGQVIAAIILIRSGIYIKIFESPGFFIYGVSPFYIYLDWLITILWVVGITNAFNFVDSMDGLAVGLGGMAAAFFMLVTLDSGQLTLSLYSALVLGICIGLYFYNAPPALLFLGDSGAQSLGFILAVLAIGYLPQGVYQASSWFIPVLLLGVPIFDAALIIVSRLRRKRPIYSAARDHTYHRLLNLGFDSNRAVLVMHFAALVLSCLAFLILNQPPLVANITFFIVTVLGISFLVFLDSKTHWV